MARRTNQRIDSARLWDSLMKFAAIGATPKGGVRRLALSHVDRQGRDLFRAHCEEAGLAVRVDAIGNMFARREGRDPSRPPVLFGSHLDSQPSGGKFDGALGVLAGLEVVRSLNDLEIVTEAPIELVNWTDEEGARFGHSLMGSGVWAGVYDQAKTEALKDLDGITVGQALDSTGIRGPEKPVAFPADAYFELHIEQGPILEREGRAIGVVTGAQAQDIVSGAGHDAVYVARHVPTAMIFTPCKDGLSHNEAESIRPEEAEAGCQVLFEVVLARADAPGANSAPPTAVAPSGPQMTG